jgi:hypothetical protein
VTTPVLAGAPAAEFLRVVLALRAVAFEVRLVEAGAGVGALDAARRRDDDDVGPLLASLASEGVPAARAEDLAAAIAGADTLLVLADPSRAGTPPVLRLRRGEAPSEAALAAVLTAGQVVLE